ncbi:elongation factor P 5-aminopentanone reductase [Caldinitratiruptor microaerophilus]|uniref:Beta-ketoacyl-ACP reductase n=1 Tax=Caldinitratiruptor microaerophilus TaxID=671077 RepID=A0AA35G8D3_9FIRM|nr:3-oxoacyl-ACP reductase FabG [Caldinitratiruptor microaerophilus]BDG60951.1 beta-ketoacyl-ACP reductase [Caldinitratiruptor microaerophilus]
MVGPLAGRAALVTGASRGIGRAIALSLARAGAAVCVNYSHDVAGAQTTVEAIRRLGAGAQRTGDVPPAFASQADVADPREARRLVEAAARTFGRLDVLVHNAGVALEKLILDTTPAEWDRLWAVHLGGAVACVRAALPYLRASGAGRIILISSIWGLTGAAGEAAYAAAKAALAGYARGLARELAPAGITVNAVAPGAIETEMLADLTPADREDLVRRIPLGRIGRPEDVAEAVLFLASDGASYITGQVVSVNGGWAM